MAAKTHLAIALAAALAAAPALAGAEQGSGTVTYVTVQAEVADIGGGATVRRGHSKGVILADDPASVFHLATQDCTGATVIGADGAVLSDSGSCDAVDREGDTWALWYANDAAGRRWEIIGGTGRYAGMTGDGTTEVLLQTPDGRMTLRWSGSWQR